MEEENHVPNHELPYALCYLSHLFAWRFSAAHLSHNRGLVNVSSPSGQPQPWSIHPQVPANESPSNHGRKLLPWESWDG